MTPRRPTVAAVLVATALTSCGRSGPSASGPAGRAPQGASRQGTLTVLAAASLARVFPEAGRLFTRREAGVPVTFSFAGTDFIATQIEHGAPADVFAGASASYGDRLAAQGLVDRPVSFCTNRLVLVVPPSNPAGIRSLEDLAAGRVKLVIGSETVPVGAYTRIALRRLDSVHGPGYSTRVLANVVSNEADVESVLAKVRSGEADAGFVYTSDAVAAGPAVRSFPLPPRAQAEAVYSIAAVTGSEHPGLARAFVDHVLSPPVQRLLGRAGFGPPRDGEAR